MVSDLDLLFRSGKVEIELEIREREKIKYSTATSDEMKLNRRSRVSCSHFDSQPCPDHVLIFVRIFVESISISSHPRSNLIETWLHRTRQLKSSLATDTRRHSAWHRLWVYVECSTTEGNVEMMTVMLIILIFSKNLSEYLWFREKEFSISTSDNS